MFGIKCTKCYCLSRLPHPGLETGYHVHGQILQHATEQNQPEQKMDKGDVTAELHVCVRAVGLQPGRRQMRAVRGGQLGDNERQRVVCQRHYGDGRELVTNPRALRPRGLGAGSYPADTGYAEKLQLLVYHLYSSNHLLSNAEGRLFRFRANSTEYVGKGRQYCNNIHNYFWNRLFNDVNARSLLICLNKRISKYIYLSFVYILQKRKGT